jgi:hypothetical protein
LPEDLPTAFTFERQSSAFKDDRWRAMVGFARKIQLPGPDKYSYRCMDRICSPDGGSIPFFEYRWSYFFSVSFNNATAWADPSAFQTFQDAYNNLPSASPGTADVEAWQKASDTILALCRSEAAGGFKIPEHFGIFAGLLPGYQNGMGPITPGRDADCTPPSAMELLARNASRTAVQHHTAAAITPQ